MWKKEIELDERQEREVLMTEKVQAIVIKSNDKKEKDKSILLFSLEQGK